MRGWSLLLAVFILLGSAAEAASQSPTTLEGVQELVRQGRTEEARRALLQWWDTGYRGASRRDVQRSLWLRAQLTVDPRQANLDYRRLVVEYPGGPFSDLALFRLAQSAYALGDSTAASEHVARLLRDYPGGAAARDAETWWARPGPLPPPAAQPREETAGPDPVKDAEPDDPGEPYAVGEPQVAVQLGAFSVRQGAEAVHREVSEAGFAARIVRIGDDGLYRVRVGLFRSSDDAADMLRRLRNLGFSAALARDAHLEVPVGR